MNVEIKAETESPTLLQQVPEFLGWSNQKDILREACRGHIRWAFYRLRLWSSEINFFEHIHALPSSRQSDLLLSPLMHHRLFLDIAPSQEIRVQLCNYLMDKKAGFSDLVVDADSVIEMPNRSPLKCASTGPAFSLLANADFGKPQVSTRAELQLADERLRAAIELIRRISPQAYMMFASCVQLIVRISLPEDDTLTSSSHRNIIGRVTIGNTHSSTHDIDDIADALVHESIHAFLYKLELIEPIFADIRIASKHSLVSPWSGRTLSLTSFVHACFVWFGLQKFWREGEQAGHSTEKSRKLMNKALAGFNKSIDWQALSPEAGVSTGVTDVIRNMWNSVSR
jgi:hypothetical protein